MQERQTGKERSVVMDNSISDSRASWYARPSAERAVISLCLQNISSFIDVSSKLSVVDFLIKENRVLFTVLQSLLSVGVEKFDLPVVASAINDFGMLENIGGYDYLDALYRSDVGEENLAVYTQQVLDASVLFKLHGELQRSAEYVHSSVNQSDVSTSSVVAAVEDKILSISLETLKVSDGHQLADDIDSILKEYESNPVRVKGLSSGFPILDRLLNGFTPGGLYVLAARPKTGKSSTLLNWALNISIQQKKPILYIDTEMSFKEYFQPRALSYLSGVPQRVIVNGLYTKDEKQLEAVYYAAQLMKKTHFIHKYMPGFRVEDVRSVVRKYHARDKIGAFVFDYVKMAELEDNFNETQMLGHIASSLKDLAGSLNIPGLTAVQLNREAEGKSRISSNMVADSDRVLRYCDALMALTRKSKKEIDTDGIDCGTHRLQVLENRNGSSFYSGIDIMFKGSLLTVQEASVQSSDSILEQRKVEEESKDRR